MNKQLSKKIISKLKSFYGEVDAELNYENIYQLTIAVILSAQTTDKQVNKVTPALFAKYPDFKTLSEGSLQDITELVKTVGFFRNKAKNILNLAIMLKNEYDLQLPDSMDELTKLPGVGRKSANVILSQGFFIQAFAVDTHVGRIARRLGYSTNKSPDKVEKDVTALIPREDWTASHLLFINHGRKFCKARNPICTDCPIFDLCAFDDKNL